jgi:ankyrin repeat protein
MRKIICIISIFSSIIISCNQPENLGSQLFKAIQDNNTGKVKELIKQDIDVNKYTSPDGDSALLYAILVSSDDMVNLLLDNGAQPGPVREGEHWNDMSIITAINLNKFDIAKTLIKRGVGVNAVSIKGATLLIYASCKGYTELVKALIESGKVDLNHSGGYWKQTALKRAKTQRNEEIVKLLTEAGAEE